MSLNTLVDYISNSQITSELIKRISKNNDCLLINLDGQKQKPKEVFEIPINNKYKAFAIKTDLLGCFDNPVNTVIEYC